MPRKRPPGVRRFDEIDDWMAGDGHRRSKGKGV
ncbi:hypothetical protein J2S22_006069 [Rhodoplanes tepidamans]|nr:hypothetical protein [Rhodoplanes tepidamans]